MAKKHIYIICSVAIIAAIAYVFWSKPKTQAKQVTEQAKPNKKGVRLNESSTHQQLKVRGEMAGSATTIKTVAPPIEYDKQKQLVERGGSVGQIIPIRDGWKLYIGYHDAGSQPEYWLYNRQYGQWQNVDPIEYERAWRNMGRESRNKTDFKIIAKQPNK